MSLEIEILEKIELYTRGKMSLADTLEFEKEVEANPQLNDRVQASQIVDQMVIGHEAMKLKAQMQKDMASPKSKWPVYLPVGLVVLLAGGLVYTLLPKEEVKERVVLQTPKTETKATEKKQQSLLPAPQKTAIVVPQNQTKTIDKQAEIQPVLKNETVLGIAIPEKQSFIALQPVAAVQKIESKSDSFVNKTEASQAVKIQKQAVVLHSVPEIVEEKTVPVSIAIAKNKEYVFNPDYDQSWTIPYDLQKEPNHVKIFDKTGRLFYQTNVEAFVPAEWKGESNNGANLGLGLYFFSIEYKDGTMEEGSIMIAR